MATALWIVQILLGLIFIITGSFKFFQSKEKVVASGGHWAADFAPGIIKVIAAAELISGLLLIEGKFAEHTRNPTRIGAACIVLIMLGSIYTHVRRKEYQHAAINSLFLLLALFVLALKISGQAY
jgi:uncharacterized membrane protein YphA (DoxX/SURF4 family)